MGYKVVFEDNNAVRAIEIEKLDSMNEFIEFGNDKERTVIRSLYIEAASQEDAIRQANSIVKIIWGEVPGAP